MANDMNGFIVIHRKILEWEWYTDNVVKTVFIHCLLRANFRDTAWRGHSIKRGQFITSYANLAEECGITVNQARRAISALCTTGEITHKSHGKYSVVTVVKYDYYQDDHKQDNKQKRKQTTIKPQQVNNINNNNKLITKEDDFVRDIKADNEEADDDWLREEDEDYV